MVNLWGTVQALFAAFHLVLHEAIQKTKDGAKVNFIFDRQNVFQQRAIITFNEIEKQIAPKYHNWQKLGSISYDSRADHMGLQAADLHTHAWYSFLTRGLKMTRERVLAINALTKKRDYLERIDGRYADMVCEDLSPFERELMLNTRQPGRRKHKS